MDSHETRARIERSADDGASGAPADALEALVATPDLEHVLECVFGLQAHEMRTYGTLLEAPGATVTELEDRLERDRSTVNRSLLSVQEKGLVTRERRMLETGGYVYQYTAVPVDEAIVDLHGALDRWTERVHGHLDMLGDRLGADGLESPGDDDASQDGTPRTEPW